MSKVSHSSADSLVDRGDNDGVAGNDARFIVKHADSTEDARGVDDYETSDIPLSTAGRFVLTT